MKHYSIVEVAKLLKGILKEAFPGVKFSIRSDKYSMGSSIRINWQDGPLESQVNPLVKPFEGASFDGMIDLKSYNGPMMWKGEEVRFGGDFIFANRHVSPVVVQMAAYWVHKESKGALPLLAVKPNGQVEDGNYLVPFCLHHMDDGKMVLAHNGHRDEYYNNLVHQAARSMSFAKQAKEVELPGEVVKEPAPASFAVDPKGMVN